MSNQRWQYQVAELKFGIFGKPVGDLQETLNRLGAQGWELVTMHRGHSSLQLVLKRQS